MPDQMICISIITNIEYVSNIKIIKNLRTKQIAPIIAVWHKFLLVLLRSLFIMQYAHLEHFVVKDTNQSAEFNQTKSGFKAKTKPTIINEKVALKHGDLLIAMIALDHFKRTKNQF